MQRPQVHEIFDAETGTFTYIVYQIEGSPCAIIDPVLDYDASSGKIRTLSADKVIAFVRAHDLSVEWLLETHAHADHLTAAHYLRQQLGGRIAISGNIVEVQKTFAQVFNLPRDEFKQDGSQFDYLFQDEEIFTIGSLNARALSVPGHTAACMAYQIGDALFVGDTLFMPDIGTARCDFPGGSAHILFHSIRKILDFPEDTRLFVCHDYPPAGRELRFVTTVAEQRTANIHIRDGITEEQFVTMRTQRDATLGMPKLIFPAIQINIRAGEMPPKESNGVAYLKIPLDGV